MPDLNQRLYMMYTQLSEGAADFEARIATVYRGVITPADAPYNGVPDGVTDTTAAVRNALAAAAGKKLLFTPGTWLIDPATTFSIAANTTIEWAPGATLKLKANAQIAADSYIFTATLGADNVKIINPRYDGNRANQTKRIRFMVGFKAKHIDISGAEVVDSTGSAFVLSNCPHYRFVRNKWERCGRTGADATCEAGVSLLCDVAPGDQYEAIGGVANWNKATLSGLDGLIVTTPAASVAFNESWSNGIDKTTKGAAGIWLGTSGGAGNGAHRSLVTGNKTWDNTANGIDCGPCSTLLVGVKYTYNASWANGTSGIQVDYQDRPFIESNHCWNNYQPAAGGVVLSAKDAQKGGIVIASNNIVQKARIKGNHCWDDQAVKTQVWGLQIIATNTAQAIDLIVEDNNFAGNLTGAIGSEYGAGKAEFVTSGYGSFKRNEGYAPVIAALTAAGTKIPFVDDTLVLNLGAATNVFGLTTGRRGDVVTVIFNSGNATLKAAGGVFVLKGFIDVTPGAGNTMTFRFDGVNWREMSRSF